MAGRSKAYSTYSTLFFFLLHLFATEGLCQQENDLQMWNMTAVSKKLGQQYTTSLTIIDRVNDNVSRPNDISFDWRLKRKIKGGLSGQLAFRHWTFTRAKPVYFFWYDLIYVHKKPTYKWVNLLRVHHGLDWVGKEQADFVRWRNHYYHQLPSSKLVPFIGCDLWYRLNGRNMFQNFWIELGTEYPTKKFNFRLFYRRITKFKDQPGWKRHAIVTGMFFKVG